MSSRYRGWCITINNPGQEDPWYEERARLHIDQGNITHLAYQRERGEEGTPHLQMFLRWSSGKTLRATKRCLTTIWNDDGRRAHLEQQRGSVEQAMLYCAKEDTRMEGHTPFSYGDINAQGRRTDIEAYRDFLLGAPTLRQVVEENPLQLAKYPRFTTTVLNVALESRALERYTNHLNGDHPYTLTVKVYWGKTGTGKTSRVFRKHNPTDIYIWSKTGDGTTWFDGYLGQPVVLFDDFYGQIAYSYLLRLLDIYPLQVQVKGGHTWFCPDIIYITSNDPPDRWYNIMREAASGALLRRITKVKEIL